MDTNDNGRASAHCARSRRDCRQARHSRRVVEFAIGLLAEGWSEAEIIVNYPGLAHVDILACLAMRATAGAPTQSGISSPPRG
jgi:hypothetical protein